MQKSVCWGRVLIVWSKQVLRDWAPPNPCRCQVKACFCFISCYQQAATQFSLWRCLNNRVSEVISGWFWLFAKVAIRIVTWLACLNLSRLLIIFGLWSIVSGIGLRLKLIWGMYRWGNKLGIKTTMVRMYFIYLSFFTVGSPVIIYFIIMVFILSIKTILSHFIQKTPQCLGSWVKLINWHQLSCFPWVTKVPFVVLKQVADEGSVPELMVRTFDVTGHKLSAGFFRHSGKHKNCNYHRCN